MLRLITICLLAAFSLLNLTAMIPKSLGPLFKAVDLIKKNLNYLGLGAAAYSLVTVVFVPFVSDHDSDLILDFIAHIFLIIMTLPYIANFLEQKASAYVPPAIIAEFNKGFVDWIRQREKTVGIIGAVLAFLLFLSLAGMFDFEIVGPPTIQ
jgi:hypothetical protein